MIKAWRWPNLRLAFQYIMIEEDKKKGVDKGVCVAMIYPSDTPLILPHNNPHCSKHLHRIYPLIPGSQ